MEETKIIIEYATMKAQLSVLRRLMDKEDIEAAAARYDGSIQTDLLCRIFGWEMCQEAKEIIKDRKKEDC